jgi:hypothetical protein
LRPSLGRISGLLVAALTLGLCVGLPTASNAVTTGSEVVLPGVYGDTLPRVWAVGNAKAFAWVKDAYDDKQKAPLFYNYETGDVARAGVVMQQYDMNMSGAQLSSRTMANGSAAVDVNTGEVTTLRASYATLQYFLGGTGDGWLDVVYDYGVGQDRVARTVLPNRTTTHYLLPKIGGELPDQADMESRAADPSGAVLLAKPYGDRSTGTLAYLDFATGLYTTLAGGSAAVNARVAMNGATVVWNSGGRLHWLDRTDLAAGRQDGPEVARVFSLAVSGSNVAVVGPEDGIFQAWSGPITGPLTKVTSDVRIGSPVMPRPNGAFAVEAGDTVRNFGIYRLAPSSTSLGDAIVTFGFSPPYGIDASGGRLVSVLPTKENTSTERLVTASGDDSTVTVSRAETLTETSRSQTPPDPSGGHSARLECRSYDCEVIVQDGDVVVARYDVPWLAYKVTESGQYLLVTVTSDTDTNGTLDDGFGIVIDTDTGERYRVPETTALYAHSVAYFKRSGEVRVRDVLTGDERVVRSEGLPEGVDHGRAGRTVVRMVGEWVFYAIPDSNGVAREAVAVNLRSGARVDVPMTASPSDGSHTEVELVDGVVSWIDPDDRSVHLYDLSTGLDEVVGIAHQSYPNRDWLAMADEFVAWVAQDDTTHVLALEGIATTEPRYLGGITAAAFSPDADGSLDAYRPQLDVTRPLSSWTLRVRRASTGVLVRTMTGKARRSAVRPVWDGRNKAGDRVADGRYVWSLTGSSAVGALRRSSGSSDAITGSVVVDTDAPKASISVAKPKASAVRDGLSLRWSSSEPRCRYTVWVSIQVQRADGSYRWSKAKRWLGTSKTQKVYDGSVPYAVKHGRTFRFQLRATDEAGNRSGKVETHVAVP